MNLIPNPLLTNVLDLMKMDHQNASFSTAAQQIYSSKNNLENDSLTHNSTANINTQSLENLIGSRSISSHLIGNSSLPFGAQIFTIPASLATFPNSDLIPVFVNSLGQMVLANTGNLLANSLASLATTLSSIQQLSTNHDSSIYANSLTIPQNNGILDHLMQQYQQLQMMKNSVLQQTWSSTFQQPRRDQSPTFVIQPAQTSVQNSVHPDPSDKLNCTQPFSIPTSSTSTSLPSDKLQSSTIPPVDYRASDNKSPSATSSVSSRSVGNKINQMIDVSNDYILGQDDHFVKEKAAELMRQSYSQHGININGNEANRCVNNIGYLHPPTLDKVVDPTRDFSQGNQSMTVDGVDIGEIREFARNFKIKRLSMGLTQTQVGQALTAAEGPAYSQSAICRFEKLDITPKSAQKIKPILEKWIKESEEKFRNGDNSIEEGSGSEINKKRKRRTSFTPQALELLNIHFEKKSHPTGSEMRTLANELNYDREVIRVWFCNKRQALKNSTKRVKPSHDSDIQDPCKSKLPGCDGDGDKDSTKTKHELNLIPEDHCFINGNTFKSEAEDLSVERRESDCRVAITGQLGTTIECSD